MKIKEMEEKRAELLVELDAIMPTEEETRELNVEDFNSKKAEIEAIDKQIEAHRSYENLNVKKIIKNEGVDIKVKETLEVIEQRDLEGFADFCRGVVNTENRAFDVAGGTKLIPTTISSKIIEKVKELAPIYASATIFNVKGNLEFPVYTEGVIANYVADMEEVTESKGTFTTIVLQNYIVGVLSKISKSLVNNVEFDIANFVMNKVSESIATFLENELINGKTKIKGLETIVGGSETATVGKITGDDLIDCQDSIPEILQANAQWVMNKNDLTKLRKLKNTNGDYILGKLLDGFGYELLNKKVLTSPSVTEGHIFYGDLSGLYVKLSQGVELQTLTEKYATQHAIGFVAHIECDANIVEAEKLTKLTVKTV